MLARAALRIASGRAATVTRSTPTDIRLAPTIRTYAKDDKPHRAPPKPPVHAKEPLASIGERTSTGPISNRTWSPDKPISFASSTSSPPPPALEADLIPGAPDYVTRAQEAAAEPPTISQSQSSQPVTIPVSSTPRKSLKLNPDVQAADPDRLQPEVNEALRATRDNAATPESGHSQSASPLPDLRQGIPSTFEQEYSDRSSSFKTQDSLPPSLDITEDPAAPGGGRKGTDELPKEAYVSSIDRRRNTMARALTIAFFAFSLTGALYMGQNWESKAEEALYPEAPNGWSPTAVYNRIRVRLSRTLGYYTEPAFPKLLPEVDPNMRPPYTLVLSLEDLLISSKWSRTKGWEVAKRPGVDYFLRYLSQYYELVIFTSVQMMNADPIIRKLDPYRIVMWPLFREATRYMNGEHVKVMNVTSALDRHTLTY